MSEFSYQSWFYWLAPKSLKYSIWYCKYCIFYCLVATHKEGCKVHVSNRIYAQQFEVTGCAQRLESSGRSMWPKSLTCVTWPITKVEDGPEAPSGCGTFFESGFVCTLREKAKDKKFPKPLFWHSQFSDHYWPGTWKYSVWDWGANIEGKHPLSCLPAGSLVTQWLKLGKHLCLCFVVHHLCAMLDFGGNVIRGEHSETDILTPPIPVTKCH